MKNILIPSILMLASSAFAQTAVAPSAIVHLNNGETATYNLADIDRLTFTEIAPVSLLWMSASNTGEFRSVSPALSPDGSHVYTTSEDHQLRCYDAATGEEIWAFDLRDAAYGSTTSGNTLCSPAVDTDGTIFVGTGTSHGKLFAINPDGTAKWCAFEDPTTGFWNNGNAPAVYIGNTTPIVSGDYVYIGNRGSAGTMVAFDKATGKRANFVTRPTSDTAGPAGGFQAECVANANGMIYLYCNVYGVGGVKMSDFTHDNTATHMSWETVHKNNTKCSGTSAIDKDGNLITLVQANSKTTVACITEAGTVKWETPVTTADLTDQGGISIAPDGTIYAAMKKGTNLSGGIVALSGEGSIKWHYEINENVSCAPAIDRSGNIAFVTESGNLYVIAADGNETIAKADMGEMLAGSESDNAANWAASTAKMWSAPVISDNGTIYFGVTNTADNTKSSLVAVQIDGFSGPATTGWPMRGRTAQHSCQAR